MMSIDFVERFFKLTLDNVYRFSCSLLFAVAVAAGANDVLPLQQLAALLDWLAIPSDWLISVSNWIAPRGEVVAMVALLLLVASVMFAAPHRWNTRAGSSALLSIVLILEVGQRQWVVSAPAMIVGILVVLTGGTAFFIKRTGGRMPEWPAMAWTWLGNATLTIGLAALYVISPLGWLMSRETFEIRGTWHNPVYIKQLTEHTTSGAPRR